MDKVQSRYVYSFMLVTTTGTTEVVANAIMLMLEIEKLVIEGDSQSECVARVATTIGLLRTAGGVRLRGAVSVVLQAISGEEPQAGSELVTDLDIESVDIRVDQAIVVDQPKLTCTATIVVIGLGSSVGI